MYFISNFKRFTIWFPTFIWKDTRKSWVGEKVDFYRDIICGWPLNVFSALLSVVVLCEYDNVHSSRYPIWEVGVPCFKKIPVFGSQSMKILLKRNPALWVECFFFHVVHYFYQPFFVFNKVCARKRFNKFNGYFLTDKLN
jgi:hypothetical protein